MKSARMGSNSRTRAASAMYDNERHNLDKFVEGLPPQDWQVGAVFAIRGQIAGLDVFDSPRTWALLMPKLVRSYGLDALDRGIGGDGFAEPSPGRFLDAVSGDPGCGGRVDGRRRRTGAARGPAQRTRRRREPAQRLRRRGRRPADRAHR